MSARKTRNAWWVDFRFQFRRYRFKSPHDSRAAAADYELLLRRELATSGSLDRFFKKPEAALTFAVFSERWLRDYVDVNSKPSVQIETRRTLSADLLPTFGSFPLAAITSEIVEQYKARKLSAGLCAKTINNRLSIIRKCLGTAVDWSDLAMVPRIRPLRTTPPTFRYLSGDEVDRLVAAAPDDLMRAMIRTAAQTGLRFSELAALRWNDIDPGVRSFCVQRAIVRGHEGSPKNHRIRHVPLTTDVIDLLARLPRVSDRIFHGPSGQAISYELAYKRLETICRRAGIRRLGWHVLRHSYASELARRGGSLLAIRDLLGHSTVEMTQRYAHLAPSVLRDTVALLEPAYANFGHQVVPAPLQTATYALSPATQVPSTTLHSPLNIGTILAA